MGIECPVCGEWKPYVSAITATGEPALKGKEIIARKLGCGHVVGNEEYMEYRVQLQEIEAEAARNTRAIEAALKRKKTALWSAAMAPAQEV
jgi:hypothetical protein